MIPFAIWIMGRENRPWTRGLRRLQLFNLCLEYCLFSFLSIELYRRFSLHTLGGGLAPPKDIPTKWIS